MTVPLGRFYPRGGFSRHFIFRFVNLSTSMERARMSQQSVCDCHTQRSPYIMRPLASRVLVHESGVGRLGKAAAGAALVSNGGRTCHALNRD